MNKKNLMKVILFITIIMSLNISIAFADTSDDIKSINEKILQLEKENKSLKETLSKINLEELKSKDELIKSYEKQNQGILQTTDSAIKNINSIITLAVAAIGIFGVIISIVLPIVNNRQDDKRLTILKDEFSKIEKSLEEKQSTLKSNISDLEKNYSTMLLNFATNETEYKTLKNNFDTIEEKLNNLLSKSEKSAEEAKKSAEKATFYKFYNAANLFFNKCNYNLALENYTKALEINPNDSDTLCNRGGTYYNLDKYIEALTDLNNSLKINPNNSMALFNRGNVYCAIKEYNLALTDYNKSLELNPKDIDTISALANLYRIMNLLDDAEKELISAKEIDSSHYYVLGIDAEIALAKDDKPKFYELITKSFENGLPIEVVYKDAIYKKVLGEDKFKALLEKYKDNK